MLAGSRAEVTAAVADCAPVAMEGSLRFHPVAVDAASAGGDARRLQIPGACTADEVTGLATSANACVFSFTLESDHTRVFVLFHPERGFVGPLRNHASSADDERADFAATVLLAHDVLLPAGSGESAERAERILDAPEVESRLQAAPSLQALLMTHEPRYSQGFADAFAAACAELVPEAVE